MTRKYDVRICGCGRIHFVLNKDIDDAIESDRELWLVCGGCGKTTRIGADIEHDWLSDDPEKMIYNMYSFEHGAHKDYELTVESFAATDNHKGIYKVLRSVGERPVMMTGMHANGFDHFSDYFQDNWYPDFWKIERSDITKEEIFQFIEQWKKDHVTVNMRLLLRTLDDDKLEALSCYHIKGLDWVGTKYEKEWHKK